MHRRTREVSVLVVKKKGMKQGEQCVGLCGLEKHPYEISPECVGDSWSLIPRRLDPGVLLWSTLCHTLCFLPSMPWSPQNAGSGQVGGFEEDSMFLSLHRLVRAHDSFLQVQSAVLPFPQGWTGMHAL